MMSRQSHLVAILLLSLLCMKPVHAYGLNWTICASLAMEAYLNSPNDTFLLDENGLPTGSPTRAWGISAQSATILCSEMPENFDWIFFAGGMTAWLLPWIALATQLPFGTKTRRTDLEAMLLALGSPALCIYSLALTILNSRWTRREFEEVLAIMDAKMDSQLADTIKAAQEILTEMQHVPIRIYNGPDDEIAQLIVNPENWPWWTTVLVEIRDTKQTWSYPLYAQVGLVFAVQLLAIIVYFQTASQDTDIGIGLAINCLWIWMIPAVLGWINIGTQASADSIRKSLERTTVPRLGNERQIRGRCIAYQALNPKTDSASISLYRQYDYKYTSMARRYSGQKIRLLDLDGGEESGSIFYNGSNVVIETCIGYSVEGCDLQIGCMFNFARMWNYRAAVRHVVEAFKEMCIAQRAHRTVSGAAWDEKDRGENLRGSPEMMSRYIFKYGNYRSLSDHGSTRGVVITQIWAAMIAMIMLWSSTGSALLIAYQTPVVGLGCDSGGYLLFGVIATLAWLMLILSAYLSHRWSSLRGRGKLRPNSMLGPAAVVTRLAGKTLAVINAVWVVLASSLQFTNVYDTVWCDSCALDLMGKPGWVILFASEAQIAAASTQAWISGVLISIIATLVVTFWIFVPISAIRHFVLPRTQYRRSTRFR